MLLKVHEDQRRADTFLAEATDNSRSFVKTLFDKGLVMVNGRAVGAGARLKAGDTVEVDIPATRELSAEPEDIPIRIVYEDPSIVVVNKERGMVVHPAAGSENGTLVNALLFHIHDLSGINGVLRPGIVHRLDKDTSGLLVAAKTDDAHRSLAGQIKEKTAGRTYIALVNGNVKQDSGTVNAPIGRSRTDRKKMAVVRDGRDAVTHFSVIARYGRYTLLRCVLETGRTHQIRVHMAYKGHPLVGDFVYGPERNEFGVSGQLLHAAELRLEHPDTGERVTFFAPMPAVFAAVLERLKGMER